MGASVDDDDRCRALAHDIGVVAFDNSARLHSERVGRHHLQRAFEEPRGVVGEDHMGSDLPAWN